MTIEVDKGKTIAVKLAFSKVVEAAIFDDMSSDCRKLVSKQFDDLFMECGCLGSGQFIFSFDELKNKWEAGGEFEVILSQVSYPRNKNGTQYRILVKNKLTQWSREFLGKHLTIDKLVFGVDASLGET